MSGGRQARAALALAAALVCLFLVLPTAVVVLMSFSSGRLMTFPPPGFGLEWYANFFRSSKWTGSALNSLQIALIATAAATALGTLAAFGIVRGRPPAGRVLIGLMLSPLIVPVIVTALGMFLTFRSLGLGPFEGLVIAHTVLAMPYVFVTVLAALHDLDPDFERAALGLGARPFACFRRIVLPLIAPSIAIGAIFAFVASWDEVVVALFLATPQMRTLPVTMWEEARHSVDPTIAAASSLLTALTFLIVVVLPVLGRRRRLAPAPREVTA